MEQVANALIGKVRGAHIGRIQPQTQTWRVLRLRDRNCRGAMIVVPMKSSYNDRADASSSHGGSRPRQRMHPVLETKLWLEFARVQKHGGKP